MRVQVMHDCKRKQAVDEMPWAGVVVKVEGGYMGFESDDDYQTWRRQK